MEMTALLKDRESSSHGSFKCPKIEDRHGFVSSPGMFERLETEHDHPRLTETKLEVETEGSGGEIDAAAKGGESSSDDSSEIIKLLPSPAEVAKIEEELKDFLICANDCNESSDDEDYGMKDATDKDWEIWRQFRDQLEKSEGFDVDIFPPRCFMARTRIRPCPRFKDFPDELKDLKAMAKLALAYFNERENKEYQFVEIEKVVKKYFTCITYYLTFKAKDTEGVKTFQAKVYDGIREQDVELCRIKNENEVC